MQQANKPRGAQKCPLRAEPAKARPGHPGSPSGPGRLPRAPTMGDMFSPVLEKFSFYQMWTLKFIRVQKGGKKKISGFLQIMNSSLRNRADGGLAGVPTNQETFRLVLEPDCLHSEATALINSVDITPKRHTTKPTFWEHEKHAQGPHPATPSLS